MRFFAIALAGASLATAHLGCDGYAHGQDLYRRDPSQAIYEERLRARHPQVNARVLGIEQLREREVLEKRASPTTYAASLTRVNVASHLFVWAPLAETALDRLQLHSLYLAALAHQKRLYPCRQRLRPERHRQSKALSPCLQVRLLFRPASF